MFSLELEEYVFALTYFIVMRVAISKGKIALLGWTPTLVFATQTKCL